MIKEVKWEKPNLPFLNLKNYWSALYNPRKIGGGTIVRDHRGNMTYAFIIAVRICTSNQAEI